MRSTPIERPDHRFRRLDVADTAPLLIDHQVGTMLFGITDVAAVNLRNTRLSLPRRPSPWTCRSS